jgi:hypothetical protein
MRKVREQDISGPRSFETCDRFGDLLAYFVGEKRWHGVAYLAVLCSVRALKDVPVRKTLKPGGLADSYYTRLFRVDMRPPASTT